MPARLAFSCFVLVVVVGLAEACNRGEGASPTDAALDVSAGAPDLRRAEDLATGGDDLRGDDLSASPDLATVPPGDGGPFVCYGDGSSFPVFDRACAVTADCAIGFHQSDCCGSERALGLRSALRNAFDVAEAAFRVKCPAVCDCPVRATLADDGKTGANAAITVSCDGGRCTSHGT